MSELGEITRMPSYHCSDNVSIEWYKGITKHLNYICMSELGGITHMPSYLCSDNVSIEYETKVTKHVNYICEWIGW
jgi:hypothetical protein